MTTRAFRAGRLPLLIAACLICAIVSINLYRLTSATAPRNPWESLQVVEAWRSLSGMPVYELPPDGHATHNYGALVPWVQGQISGGRGRTTSRDACFRWCFRPSLWSPCSRSSALPESARSGPYAIAWAALLGVNHRSGNYFAENRPDMTALFLGAGAVVLFGLGMERKRWPLVVLGTACLVAGFFFKQTVSIFSAVPLIALLIRWRRPARSEIVLAGIPLVVMASVILGLGFYSPAVHHYMIAVQSGYAINWPRAAKFFWELLLDSPLFLVLLAELVFFGEGLRRDDTRARWLLAVLAIAIPFSVIAFAKVRLAQQPAARTSGDDGLLRDATAPHGQAPRGPLSMATWASGTRLVSGGLALDDDLSALDLGTRADRAVVTVGQGLPRDAGRRPRRLPGTVVCPEDPTIPLYGNGYIGLNLFSEKDARSDRGNWPHEMPEPVLAEMPRPISSSTCANTGAKTLTTPCWKALGFKRWTSNRSTQVAAPRSGGKRIAR